MFANQYKGRRVFITGHTGFKGSWLTLWLLELGAKVCGFSLDIPSQPSAFEELGLASRIRHIQGDVRNLSQVQKAIQEFQPDMVFHMAAQALVRPSYEDPCTTFSTNAIGTMNVLEAVRHTPGIQAVVCITSDKCYRNDEWEWGYRETDHLGGDDPYSASKACAEIIAHSYFQSYFKNGPAVATVRAGNVIGGGDWALDRIVPDCARAYATDNTVALRNPWATRPWQHVLEPLSGYLWLGALLMQGDTPKTDHEPFNFGPSSDVNNNVQEVVEALAAHWPNFAFEVDTEAAKAAKESTLLKLCCDKALARLQWKSVLRFEETIRFTAVWYHDFYKVQKSDMYSFTAAQIAEYCVLAVDRGLTWAL